MLTVIAFWLRARAFWHVWLVIARLNDLHPADPVHAMRRAVPNRILRDWTDSDKVELLSSDAERLFVRLIMPEDHPLIRAVHGGPLNVSAELLAESGRREREWREQMATVKEQLEFWPEIA